MLAPRFEELADRYGDRITFLKMDRSKNRAIMKSLSLTGVPSIIFLKDGREAEPRLTGDVRATPEHIEDSLKALLRVL